jgi:hypothetical protein
LALRAKIDAQKKASTLLPQAESVSYTSHRVSPVINTSYAGGLWPAAERYFCIMVFRGWREVPAAEHQKQFGTMLPQA